MSNDGSARAGDVLRFWRRVAGGRGVPFSDQTQAEPLSVGKQNLVYKVTDGDFTAVVRWRSGPAVPAGLVVQAAGTAPQDPVTPGRSNLKAQPGFSGDREALRITVAAADLGLAPRVLFVEDAAGELDWQPVIVSSHLDGPALDRDWFRENIWQAATLLARLHSDETLTDLLDHYGRGDPRSDALAAARGAAADSLLRLDALQAQTAPPALRAVLDELTGLLAWLGAQLQREARAFAGQRLGPAHSDVNFSNWLRDADNRAYLVDWDGARLDDPALDVGMLLHWYVPTALWPRFAQHYAGCGNQPVDAETLLARARLRYPLHAVDVILWRLGRFMAQGEADEAACLAFVEPFLLDLRRLRAGTFRVT